MRLRILSATAVVALVLSCERDAVPLARPAPEAAPQRRAVLVGVDGPVRVKRALQDDWIEARAGMALASEDKVRTHKGGSAHVSFEGGNTIALDEESLISISSLGASAKVRLLSGRVDADVVEGGGAFHVQSGDAEVGDDRGEITFQ